MSTAPKKSSLADLSPIAPPPPAAETVQINVRIPAADAARLRRTVTSTAHLPSGYRSVTDLVRSAAMQEVERLERELNDGQPFS